MTCSPKPQWKSRLARKQLISVRDAVEILRKGLGGGTLPGEDDYDTRIVEQFLDFAHSVLTHELFWAAAPKVIRPTDFEVGEFSQMLEMLPPKARPKGTSISSMINWFARGTTIERLKERLEDALKTCASKWVE